MKRHERSSGGVFQPPESEARGHLAAWKPRTCCWDARLWRSRPGLVPLRGPGAWPRAVTAKASAPGRCAHAGRSAEQPGPVRPAPARRAARRPLRARTTAPRPALPRRLSMSLRVPSCVCTRLPASLLCPSLPARLSSPLFPWTLAGPSMSASESASPPSSSARTPHLECVRFHMARSP